LAKEKTTKGGDAAVHEHTFGGQAVIEGVMMRGRNSWGLAVRRPSGGIARMAYAIGTPDGGHKWLKWPVVRGVAALYDSLALGIRALRIAANVSLEDESGDSPSTPEAQPAEGSKSGEAFGFKEMAGTMLVAIVLTVGLFIAVPLFLAKLVSSNSVVYVLLEGVIRIAIFLLYILGVSLIPDLRRVFMYHGAEHKVIHAYEACGRPDAEEARRQSTLHPRCGTGFLLLVMVLAVFVFALVAIAKLSLPYLVLSRIIGIPVIVGVAYEVGIKWLGRRPDGIIARIALWPGLQLQRLTTRQPTDDQLEVAAAALEEVIAMDASLQAPTEPVTA
jgi:uncharacterized protein YqhQ